MADLENAPTRPFELYMSSTVPFFPCLIGSFEKFGMVHPQLAFVLVILIGLLPLFVKVKVAETFSLSIISPKEWLVLSNETRFSLSSLANEPVEISTDKTNDKITPIDFFMISEFD